MQKPQILETDSEIENEPTDTVDILRSDNNEKKNQNIDTNDTNDTNDVNDDKDYSKWKIIYPNYLNKQKKIREGRRTNEKYCVNNPSIYNIEVACRELKVAYVVEKHKCYPRDWEVEGRIRIKIPDEKLQIFNKFDLMRKIGLKMQQMNVNNVPPSYSLEPCVVIDEHSAITTKKKKKKSKEKNKERNKEKE